MTTDLETKRPPQRSTGRWISKAKPLIGVAVLLAPPDLMDAVRAAPAARGNSGQIVTFERRMVAELESKLSHVTI